MRCVWLIGAVSTASSLPTGSGHSAAANTIHAEAVWDALDWAGLPEDVKDAVFFRVGGTVHLDDLRGLLRGAGVVGPAASRIISRLVSALGVASYTLFSW
jgi:hypothetical protein